MQYDPSLDDLIVDHELRISLLELQIETKENSLYKVIKRMLERGQRVGLAEKIELFYLFGRLSLVEYNELMMIVEIEK